MDAFFVDVDRLARNAVAGQQTYRGGGIGSRVWSAIAAEHSTDGAEESRLLLRHCNRLNRLSLEDAHIFRRHRGLRCGGRVAIDDTAGHVRAKDACRVAVTRLPHETR